MDDEDDAQEMIDESEEEEVSAKKGSKDDEDTTELVKDAVGDLDKELERIRKQRTPLVAEIKRIDDIVKNAEQVGKKAEKLRYKRRIAKLDAEEAELLDRRRKLEEKENSLNRRMGKVKGIKDKLSGV